MADWMRELGPTVATIASVLVSALASGHALLRKRDSRAAVAWVGLIWLLPAVGTVLYALLGVNRIRRRARALRRERRYVFAPGLPHPHSPKVLRDRVGAEAGPLVSLAELGDRVTGVPMLEGNAVTPLLDGDQAYPAMLEAIDQARTSVSMTTYIMDNDAAGTRFVEALRRAVSRSVQVRVLVDAVGARYSLPPIHRTLRRSGVRVARFLPTLAPSSLLFLNLRSHRKILVVDGAVGFTGGMNVRHGHVVGENPRHPTRDLHFRLEGPVVAELQAAFCGDWAFTTGEVLSGEAWFPQLTAQGRVVARAISDGPDDDYEQLRSLLLGALAAARRSVTIVTPYFLPDAGLIDALGIAAQRGVRVDLVLPERGNLRLVQWATRALLWQVLTPGCRVHLTPPPFDHTKLMLVDGAWVLFGSTNWDPRSLRLNFEFNVECYDQDLATRLGEVVAERIARARPLTLAEVDGRPLAERVRDSTARLFSPYL